MGSYKEIKGDLLDMFDNGEFDMIAQSCNCFQSMGAGLAAQIRDRYPTAYMVDRVDMRSPSQRWGDLTFDRYSEICNLYSQFNPGRDVDYVALRMSLKKMARFYAPKDGKIGLPQLSAGIAGGDWKIIKQIIQEELKEFDVTVVIWDKN